MHLIKIIFFSLMLSACASIVNVDYDKKHFAETHAELIKIWQLQLRISTLSRLHEKLELQASFKEEENEGNSLENDEQDSLEEKTFAELEKESRESTKKSLDDLYDLMSELDDTDWFSVFINTLTMQFVDDTGLVAASVSAVPVPAAVWLFGSGLIGLVGIARRKASV